MLFFALFGSGWFWLFLWVMLGTVCVAFDSDWLLLILSAGVLTVVKWLAKSDVVSTQSLLTILPWLLAYVPAGILWSFFKWYWLLIAYKEKVLAEKVQYEKKVKALPWADYKIDRYPPPTAKENKAKICRWIAYWPLSLVNSICYDFVKNFFNMIYEWLGSSYDRITKRVLRGIE